MDWVECVVDVEVWRGGIEGRCAERFMGLDSIRLVRGARAVV